MKYSIRGNLSMEDGSDVVDLLNKYKLWRLYTDNNKTTEENTSFVFEVWLNSEEDKTSLFNELKSIVDEFGEKIDWHECTHDEVVPQPCVIAEEYQK